MKVSLYACGYLFSRKWHKIIAIKSPSIFYAFLFYILFHSIVKTF